MRGNRLRHGGARRSSLQRSGSRRGTHRGFSYALVLAAIVVIGILAEVAQETSWRQQQADREAELIFRGSAYRRAIASYYELHQRYPRALEDLVRDPSSVTRRHLRALYSDPMRLRAKQRAERGLDYAGAAADWELIPAPDGGIRGVASRSEAVPLKKAGFPKALAPFAEAETYSEWLFEYVPATRAAPVTPAPPGDSSAAGSGR